MRCLSIAERAINLHFEMYSYDHYASIVTLQGLAYLSHVTERKDLIEKSIELLAPYYNGDILQVHGAYDNMYQSGGTPSALLLKYGYVPEIRDFLVGKAEELIKFHPRNKKGVFGMPKDPEKIWIDSVFAVCPFLAILGNVTQRADFLEEAEKQMVESYNLLKDDTTGLYHQSLNFAGENKVSEDNWSRGNGWAALALAELITEIPNNKIINELYTKLMKSIVFYQSSCGLWHQEMTDEESYIETSGSGLLLYAIGRGLELGVLGDDYRECFERGLKGYKSYIALDGSMFNTCCGCLCPGTGTKEDYKNHNWKINDIHSFGPLALALGQAIKLNIGEI